jgi:hypothetical protein
MMCIEIDEQARPKVFASQLGIALVPELRKREKP